jgi:hypothetical protein
MIDGMRARPLNLHPVRLRWALCAIVAFVACGREPTYHQIHGRVEAPAGVDLSKVTVVATRGDRQLLFPPRPPGAAFTDLKADGAFDLYVPDGGDVDLQAGTMNIVEIAASGPSGETTSADVAASLEKAQNPKGPTRRVNQVGGYEGCARGVHLDAKDVVIRLVPRITKRVRLRVVDPAGAPVARAPISWSSMGDWIGAETDADGRATIDDVPVRDWSVVAEPPKPLLTTLVSARIRLTPADTEIEIRLRRGVPIRVRLGNEPRGDVVLHVSRSLDSEMRFWPWNPDAAGESVILAEPDWPTVTIMAVRITKRSPNGADGSTLGHATVNVAEGAIADLAASP